MSVAMGMATGMTSSNGPVMGMLQVMQLSCNMPVSKKAALSFSLWANARSIGQ